MTNQTNAKRKKDTDRYSDRWFKGVLDHVRGITSDRSQNVDIVLLIMIILLVFIGIVMMFSASYAYANYNHDGDSYYFFRSQLKHGIIGVVLMLLVSLYPASRLRNFNLIVLAISTVLLILALIWDRDADFHRWIKIGGFSFQPSEITKFAIILFGATWADSHAKKMHTFKWGVLPFAIVAGITAVLLVLEPHLSCTVIVLLLTLTMMFVGGTRLIWFAGVVGTAVAGIAAVLISGAIGYSSTRIAVWLDPFVDPLGDGWQNIQALYAISSGGLMGQGLGASRQKYLYISEPQNDFVFSVVCEEVGFFGAAVIIALFVGFIWRGFTISVGNPNRFCKLLGIGITAQVGWQAFLNMAVVTKMLPNTGISLPFFSYGGTSLIMLLMEMGVLLAISRGSTAKRI